MIKEMFKIEITKKKLKQFNVLLGIIFLLLTVHTIFTNINNYTFLYISIFFFIVSFLIPSIIKPLYYVWMIFGTILGWFMTRIIISIFYFTLVTPIAIVGRLFGHKFIDRFWDKRVDSYWNYRRSDKIDKNDHLNQY